MFLRLSILLLLSRPSEYPEMFLIRNGERFHNCMKFLHWKKYIPRVTLINLAMFGSPDGGSVSAMFSSACNLSLWLFSSNSTLKNPTQYNIIPNAEMVEAKEGKRCFWAVIFPCVNKRKIRYVDPLPDTVNVIEKNLALIQPFHDHFRLKTLEAKFNPFSICLAAGWTTSKRPRVSNMSTT